MDSCYFLWGARKLADLECNMCEREGCVPISSTVSPDVSGTTNHEMQKSRTLVPAKTKPVFAPRLPLSMLYILLEVSFVIIFQMQSSVV